MIMKCKRDYMKLYAVTDSSWLNGRSLTDVVEEAIIGGVSIVQLREKNADDETFISKAKELLVVCRKHDIPLIINDRVDIALKCDADGVHIGQSDMELRQARELLGEGKLIGTSAHNVEEAKAAVASGADYLGIGSVFNTTTKLDATSLARDEMLAICKAVDVPIVGIGGVTAQNIHELKGSGVDGVAVVSAIFAQENILEATKNLRKICDETFA